MDGAFLQGLRDAKALLDDGIFSQEEFESEKAKLTAERDARAAAAAQPAAAHSGPDLGTARGDGAADSTVMARLLVGGSAAAQVLGRVAGQGVESLPSAPISPQRPTPARAVLPAPPVAESGGGMEGGVAGAKGPGPGVDRSGPVPSASELIASLNAMSVSRGVAARSDDPSSGGSTEGTEVPPGAYRALEPRNYTIEEIRQFDGGNPGDPIFLLCRGNIFDVSSREDLYGISGPYNYMAGRDASRILAKMARKGQETETVSLDDLSETELKTLQQWEDKFRQQYPIVGYLKGPSKPVSQIDVW